MASPLGDLTYLKSYWSLASNMKNLCRFLRVYWLLADISPIFFYFSSEPCKNKINFLYEKQNWEGLAAVSRNSVFRFYLMALGIPPKAFLAPTVMLKNTSKRIRFKKTHIFLFFHFTYKQQYTRWKYVMLNWNEFTSYLFIEFGTWSRYVITIYGVRVSYSQHFLRV